jgi:hypothetical protein
VVIEQDHRDGAFLLRDEIVCRLQRYTLISEDHQRARAESMIRLPVRLDAPATRLVVATLMSRIAPNHTARSVVHHGKLGGRMFASGALQQNVQFIRVPRGNQATMQ